MVLALSGLHPHRLHQRARGHILFYCACGGGRVAVRLGPVRRGSYHRDTMLVCGCIFRVCQQLGQAERLHVLPLIVLFF